MDLMIEITRRCNFECGHCLRGNAESKDFDVNTLRRFLEESKVEYISTLTLTGGEPLLRPKIIHSIVEMLNMFKVQVDSYFIATNGSKFNKESLQAICRLQSYADDSGESSIKISNSPWHNYEREDKNLICIESLDDLLTENRSMTTEVIEGPYGSYLMDLNIYKERDDYKDENMIGEGRYFGGGNEAEESNNLVYLNSLGQTIKGQANLSFTSQEKYA